MPRTISAGLKRKFAERQDDDVATSDPRPLPKKKQVHSKKDEATRDHGDGSTQPKSAPKKRQPKQKQILPDQVVAGEEAGNAAAQPAPVTKKFPPRSKQATSEFDSNLRLPLSCGALNKESVSNGKVWIIFGATGHIGSSLVRTVHRHGDVVSAIGRQDLEDASTIATTFKTTAALCDVRDLESVRAVVKLTLETHGRIDVVANCTGYGLVGAAEDQTELQIKNQFDTNYWGTVNILQATLPVFREAGEGGRLLIFSSVCGSLGVPGLAPYCATKYAVDCVVEAANWEMRPFEIYPTLVQAGLVRRDDPSSDADISKDWGHFTPIDHTSAPYDSETAPSKHVERMQKWVGDQQPTSALKCAELCYLLAHCDSPPLRFAVGAYAEECIRDRARFLMEEALCPDWQKLHFPPDNESASDMERSERDPRSRSASAEAQWAAEAELNDLQLPSP